MQTVIPTRTSRHALLPVAVGLVLVVMCIGSSAAPRHDRDIVDTPVLLSPEDFEQCVSTSGVLSWTEVSGPYTITYQMRLGVGCGNGGEAGKD